MSWSPTAWSPTSWAATSWAGLAEPEETPTPIAIVELLARVDRVVAGAVGVALRVVLVDGDTAQALDDVTSMELAIVQPDGTRLVRTAPEVAISTTESEAPCLEYVTTVGELDLAGVYTVQGYVERGAQRLPALPVRFRVWPTERV